MQTILYLKNHDFCGGFALAVEGGHDVHLGGDVGKEMAVAGAEVGRTLNIEH